MDSKNRPSKPYVKHHSSEEPLRAEKHFEPPCPPEPPPVCKPEGHFDREHREECRFSDTPSKIVERAWYFGREQREECREEGPPYGGECRDHDHDHDPCPHPGHGDKPGRPTRPPGVDTGRLGDGTPLNPGDINGPNIPGVWVGPRSEMDLPYLFMRANSGDLGKRPVSGAPFWESPDIFLLAGVPPALAPPIPAKLGDVALAGQPNTIYAHIWNFGKSAACEVVVEFYWVDPSLGISPGSVHLIAQTFTRLGAKGSGKCHTVVKCPEPWVPTFVNGGHECLLVRIWDNPSDLPGEPKFDASINRHVAQRNIHVAPAPLHALAAHIGGAPLVLPALSQPLLLKVGPLYGAPAKVAVERVSPNSVPWLQLHTGKRGVFPAMATPTGAPSLSAPATAGGGFPSTGAAAEQHVQGDDQHVAFDSSDNAPGPGEAHVYRVSATQDGAVFGGYTIVVLG